MLSFEPTISGDCPRSSSQRETNPPFLRTHPRVHPPELVKIDPQTLRGRDQSSLAAQHGPKYKLGTQRPGQWGACYNTAVRPESLPALQPSYGLSTAKEKDLVPSLQKLVIMCVISMQWSPWDMCLSVHYMWGGFCLQMA